MLAICNFCVREEQRPQFQRHLRQSLPVAADGSISLMARAWAVRGTAVMDS